MVSWFFKTYILKYTFFSLHISPSNLSSKALVLRIISGSFSPVWIQWGQCEGGVFDSYPSSSVVTLFQTFSFFRIKWRKKSRSLEEMISMFSSVFIVVSKWAIQVSKWAIQENQTKSSGHIPPLTLVSTNSTLHITCAQWQTWHEYFHVHADKHDANTYISMLTNMTLILICPCWHIWQ